MTPDECIEIQVIEVGLTYWLTPSRCGKSTVQTCTQVESNL